MELTDKDFQCFKNECQHWIDKFGLLDWRVDYAFEKLTDGYAECRTHWHGKCAVLALDRYPTEEVSTDQIRKSAFHEVCELLLEDMRMAAMNNVLPYDERKSLLNCAAHGVIRRLENSVFK